MEWPVQDFRDCNLVHFQKLRGAGASVNVQYAPSKEADKVPVHFFPGLNENQQSSVAAEDALHQQPVCLADLRLSEMGPEVTDRA